MKKFKLAFFVIALLLIGSTFISCERDNSVQPETAENYDAYTNSYTTDDVEPKKKRKKR